MIAHIYPSVLQAVSDGAMQGAWAGVFQGYRGEAMHYLGYVLEELAHEGLVPQPSSRHIPHHRGKPRAATPARAENPYEVVRSEFVHDQHCGR